MKNTSFIYKDLEVISQANPFGGWQVREFALAFCNPNPHPVTNGIYLLAKDPTFIYKNGERGTFHYPTQTYAPFSRAERFIGGNCNALQVAFDAATQVMWRGDAVVTASAPIYSWSPHEFTTKLGTGPTQAAAYNDAWQNGGPWQVPVEWDPDLRLAICPYANYWFGNDVWPQGWSTVVTIQNRTGRPGRYRVRNHLYGMYHGSQAAPCSQQNEGVTTVEIDVEDGQDVEVNPFVVPLNVQSCHDTCLSIECVPLVPGNGYSVRVVPNPAGKVLCP